MDVSLEIDPYKLNGLSRVNIIVGKNGCGKSRLLRGLGSLIASPASDGLGFGKLAYIHPERGGTLKHDSSMTSRAELISSPFQTSEECGNQLLNFREKTMTRFRELEWRYLRMMEMDVKSNQKSDKMFDDIIDRINILLDHIEIQRSERNYAIAIKSNKRQVHPDQLSSGEAELISLAMECVFFEDESIKNKKNFLLLDEPDLHLHGDLQTRLAQFLHNSATSGDFQIIVSTHSPGFIGAFRNYNDVSIAFLNFGKQNLQFRPFTEVYNSVLRLLGAHPLSNIFNEAAILLVEGEDDERIWQQAIRTSNGRIKLYPCAVGSKSKLKEYELEVKDVINAMYDSAKAYSLRDGDGEKQELQDEPPIIKCRLACRAAENLLLSDEVLAHLGTNWHKVKQGIIHWVENNKDHQHFTVFNNFQRKNFPRKYFDLKNIRNDLMGIIESNKPWEVAVGQTIGNMNKDFFKGPDSLFSYLGKKTVDNLLGISIQ